ncbi:MAG: helix-turn-helix domain-containing protein [Acidobacteria bacterium]|nr:helix-turn-helix domain-containing protein [Acidobacteriota bacterium]MBI3262420.1 helix-turn-helix domain-containing protein [Acidobacteriota bacterium]
MDARALPRPATGGTPKPFEPRLGRSVSIDHAMKVLRVSRRTVYNWIREGRLATVRTLGGSQRVVTDSLRPHVVRRTVLGADL